jgi:hypothetical protein
MAIDPRNRLDRASTTQIANLVMFPDETFPAEQIENSKSNVTDERFFEL